jgi:hypothetical protein
MVCADENHHVLTCKEMELLYYMYSAFVLEKVSFVFFLLCFAFSGWDVLTCACRCEKRNASPKCKQLCACGCRPPSTANWWTLLALCKTRGGCACSAPTAPTTSAWPSFCALLWPDLTTRAAAAEDREFEKQSEPLFLIRYFSRKVLQKVKFKKIVLFCLIHSGTTSFPCKHHHANSGHQGHVHYCWKSKASQLLLVAVTVTSAQHNAHGILALVDGAVCNQPRDETLKSTCKKKKKK